MKKLLFVLALAIGVVALSAQCKNKNMMEKTVPVPSFNNVTIMSNVTVRYTQDFKHSVKIVAEERDMDKVKVKVKDNTLLIYAETSKNEIGGVSFRTAKILNKVVVYVTAPQLSTVRCEGVGDFIAMTDILSPGRLDFSIEGSGDMSLKKVTAKDLYLSIAGAGDIDVQQVKTKKLTASVAGTGDIDIDKVDDQCSNAKLTVAGTGDIDAMFCGCDVLACIVAGTGDIKVSGNVKDFQSTVEGTGSVDRSGLVISGSRAVIHNRTSSQKNINARP